jgi:flavin reductase (DIM6/NTAB) family NADH-FMN oxidoreductase RutF
MTKKTDFPLAQVYGLLEPGPVGLVTTARAGRANIMPMSWHTMMEFVPPLVGCVISNQNYTFETLRTTGECVRNVPTVALAKKWWLAAMFPVNRWTSSKPFTLRRRAAQSSRPRLSLSVTPI